MSHQVPAVLITLAACLVLAGCRSGEKTAPMPAGPPLADLAGEWMLVNLGTDRAADLFPDPSRRPTLTLTAAGQVSGFAGINRFNGSFDVNRYLQGELDFGLLATTRMAGELGTMALETRFLEAMHRVDGMRREGDDLVLTSAETAELRFRRAE